MATAVSRRRLPMKHQGQTKSATISILSMRWLEPWEPLADWLPAAMVPPASGAALLSESGQGDVVAHGEQADNEHNGHCQPTGQDRRDTEFLEGDHGQGADPGCGGIEFALEENQRNVVAQDVAQDPADDSGDYAHQAGDQPGSMPLQRDLGADDGEQ